MSETIDSRTCMPCPKCGEYVNFADAEIYQSMRKAAEGAELLQRIASYAATVRTDRRLMEDGCVFLLQTREWCEGLLGLLKEAGYSVPEVEEVYPPPRT